MSTINSGDASQEGFLKEEALMREVVERSSSRAESMAKPSEDYYFRDPISLDKDSDLERGEIGES
jgi:hypothetical protein